MKEFSQNYFFFLLKNHVCFIPTCCCLGSLVPEIGKEMNTKKVDRKCSAASDMLVQDCPITKINFFFLTDLY